MLIEKSIASGSFFALSLAPLPTPVCIASRRRFQVLTKDIDRNAPHAVEPLKIALALLVAYLYNQYTYTVGILNLPDCTRWVQD